MLDQSSLSAVKLDLWFLKVRIQNSPRLLCLQDFQQLFPYKLHIAFHFLLYCSSSHTFLLVLQNLWKKRNGKFRMRNLILRKKMTTQVNCPCKKLRSAYSLLGPVSKVPRPRSTSTQDRRQQLSTFNKSNPDIVASFQSFANSISKLQEAKLEMHRDSERLLVEREARQLDLQLKHTQMLLDTQLEITKLLTTQTWK